MQLQSFNCAMCSDNMEETLTNLFWDCPFALNCWTHPLPDKNRGTSTYDEICPIAQLLPAETALDIILMGCWGIWSMRNDKIFRRAPIHINGWIYYLREGLHIAEIRENP